MGDSDEVSVSPAVTGIVSAVAAAVGTHSPWAAAFAALSVQPVGVVVQRSAQELRSWRHPLQVMEAAEAASGLTSPEVIEAVADDPELHPLARRLLRAAAETGNERKLRLLGTVLGEAVRNRPVAIDDAQVLTAIIAGMEVLHIRVLESFDGVAPFKIDDDGKQQPGHWFPAQIAEQTPDVDPELIPHAIGTLVSLGLVEDDVSTYGGLYSHKITPLGRRIVEVGRRVGEAGGLS
jgi:hypothetical protein